MNQPDQSTERLRVRDGTELHSEMLLGGSDIWLIGIHGIGEHIGRGNHLSQLFADRFNIFRYDLRGHGKSEGPRGYVDSFDLFYQDLEDIVGQLATRHSHFRYALFGHSMGALIAAGFVQRGSNRIPQPERLFLASPPIGIGGFGGVLVNRLPQRCVTWLRKCPFSIPIGSAINRSALSHEKTNVARIGKDPLSLKRLHTKLLFNLVEASKKVFDKPIAAPCQIFAAVGSDDKIVSCSEAQRYFAKHEPTADFRIIEGAYHELHNESAEYQKPYFDFLKQALNSK